MTSSRRSRISSSGRIPRQTKNCWRHPDQASTGLCSRCTQSVCSLCARGELCLSCTTEAGAQSQARLTFKQAVLLAVMGGIVVGALAVFINRGGPPAPTTIAVEPASLRFEDAGVSLRDIPVGYVATPHNPSRTTQVLVHEGKELVLRINSIGLLPWWGHEKAGKKSWEWQTGPVQYEDHSLDLAVDHWVVEPGPRPLLVLVKRGRFVALSSSRGLFDPTIWRIVQGLDLLPNSDQRSRMIAKAKLSPQQSTAPPPAELLASLDQMAAAIKNDYKNRTPPLDAGMEFLAKRDLTHVDALILRQVLRQSTKLMVAQRIDGTAAECPVPAGGDDVEEGEEAAPVPSPRVNEPE